MLHSIKLETFPRRFVLSPPPHVCQNNQIPEELCWSDLLFRLIFLRNVAPAFRMSISWKLDFKARICKVSVSEDSRRVKRLPKFVQESLSKRANTFYRNSCRSKWGLNGKHAFHYECNYSHRCNRFSWVCRAVWHIFTLVRDSIRFLMQMRVKLKAFEFSDVVNNVWKFCESNGAFQLNRSLSSSIAYISHRREALVYRKDCWKFLEKYFHNKRI